MTDDLERALRERVRQAFAPAAADDHAHSVRAKVTPSSRPRRRPGRRQSWAMAAALAAVVIAATIVSPRLIAHNPAGGPRPAQAPTERGSRGPVLIDGSEAEISGIVKSASELAASGQLRTDLGDARRHLLFEPTLPSGAPESETLTGLYTTSQRTGVPRSTEPDNVLVALYGNGLSVTEKQLDPLSVKGPEAFMSLMRLHLARGNGGAVRTMTVQGTTVALWDPAPGMPHAESRVYWFRNGVGYVVTAPAWSTERLVAIARTMLR